MRSLVTALAVVVLVLLAAVLWAGHVTLRIH